MNHLTRLMIAICLLFLSVDAVVAQQGRAKFQHHARFQTPFAQANMNLAAQGRANFGHGFGMWGRTAFNGMSQAQYMNMLSPGWQRFGPVNAWGGFAVSPFAGNNFGGWGASAWGSGGWGPGGWGGAVNPYVAGNVNFGYANPYWPGGGAAWGNSPYYDAGLGALNYQSGIPAGGFFLMGAGNVLNAYESIITSDEQARLLRVQSQQSRLETAKKRFEFAEHVKANAPTFSDEQAKVAFKTIARLRNNANPAEIASGRTLNVLLNGLRSRSNGDKAEVISLSDAVLRKLNVTGAAGNARNLGILRDGGRFSWPAALQDLVSAEQRDAIALQTEALVQKAADGQPPANLLTDVQAAIDGVRERLVKNVNSLPTSQFLEAKRFLNDMDDARRAIQGGDTAKVLAFQKWIAAGRSAQEVVAYLTGKGLSFAPANPGDEDAYEAMHAALGALYDTSSLEIDSSASRTKE